MEIDKVINYNTLSICLIAILPISYFVYIYSKRMTSIVHLPHNYKNFTFKGIVVSVGDGDGCKVVHLPAINNCKSWIKEDALPIRLAAIDAPEMRSFGNPEQPFARESKAFLESLIKNKTVKVQVLDIDRYNRIIGMVIIKAGWFKWKNVNLEIVKKGFACLYRSNYTSFGNMEDKFEQEELIAQQKKVGIWSDPNFVLPQDFKKANRCSKK